MGRAAISIHLLVDSIHDAAASSLCREVDVTCSLHPSPTYFPYTLHSEETQDVLFTQFPTPT